MGNGTGPTIPSERDRGGAVDLPRLGARYRIERELGRGGMGRVFEARDLKLSRDVPIKVLTRGSDDENALLRFEQEARAAASLDHPNIIAVNDVGQHDGVAFIVSELLRGQTLRQCMAGEALTVSRVLDFGVQIARGLAAAHAKGVIHRDLKPENLFVSEDGRVKILDFGIAKVTAPKESLAASPRTTQAGAILGTVGYMSPEQGAYEDALSELRKAQGPTQAATAAIGHVYAVSGRKAEAEKILDDLTARSQAEYLPPTYVARIHVGLGQRDEAIAWLEKAQALHDAHLTLIGAEPLFDPLRQDPRFVSLLRRLNLAR